MSDRLDSRARRLLELRDRASELDRLADEAKHARDAFEAELWSELEDLGLKSLTLDLGPLSTGVRASLISQAMGALDEAAFATEAGRLGAAAGEAERAAALLRRAAAPSPGKVQLVRKRTTYAQVLDRKALIKALKERGLERGLVTETEAKGRLNAFVRTALEHGEELPPGLSYRDDRYVSVTKKP